MKQSRDCDKHLGRVGKWLYESGRGALVTLRIYCNQGVPESKEFETHLAAVLCGAWGCVNVIRNVRGGKILLCPPPMA